jgi:hypothetical protein
MSGRTCRSDTAGPTARPFDELAFLYSQTARMMRSHCRVSFDPYVLIAALKPLFLCTVSVGIQRRLGTLISQIRSHKRKWVHFPFGAKNPARGEETIFWPRDLLPRTIENTRIMTYGYDADPINVWSTIEHINILQHWKGLLLALAAQRRDGVCIQFLIGL